MVCGAFSYTGVKVPAFKAVFEVIAAKVAPTSRSDELDVSNYAHWNAMDIYEHHIARPWRKSISARQMERLAVETEVFLMLEPLRAEFKRAVAARWKRIFKRSNPGDPNRPTQGWHLFREVEVPK